MLEQVNGSNVSCFCLLVRTLAVDLSFDRERDGANFVK